MPYRNILNTQFAVISPGFHSGPVMYAGQATFVVTPLGTVYQVRTLGQRMGFIQ